MARPKNVVSNFGGQLNCVDGQRRITPADIEYSFIQADGVRFTRLRPGVAHGAAQATWIKPRQRWSVREE